MRILHIIPNLKRGGAERLCIDICNQLQDRGHDVTLIVFEDSNEYLEISKNIDIQYFNLIKDFSIRKPNIEELEKFKKFVLGFKPDIVHTHLFIAELIWKMLRIETPSIFHIHDNIKAFDLFANGIFHKKTLVRIYEFFCYKKLNFKRKNHYLTISKETDTYIKRKLKPKKEEVTLLHNGFNRFLFFSDNKHDLGKIKIISIGSLVPKKNHSLALEVIKSLKELTKKDLSLVILGKGEQKKNIENKIKELEIENNVHLKGLVNNPQDFLKSSNIYLHTAYDEPFGLALVEAMASGLPVFTTDGGGNRDIIQQGKNGFIYYDRDPKKMALDILQTIENPKTYQAMSEYALNFSKSFDIKEYAKKLLKLYDSLSK